MILFMAIKMLGLLSSTLHGVDIVKDSHLNGLLWPHNLKVKSKSLKLMPPKLKKSHQDLVSEVTQQSNSSNLGQKDDSTAIDYEGGRNEQAMADWTRQQLSDLKIFEHVQLTGQSVYDEHCKGRNLCIINFLPAVIDSTEQEKQNYLNTIRKVGLRFKGKPFKLLWSQGGDQFELQEKLGVSGIGYPSVVAVFETKQVYGRLKRSFSEQNLENFLNDIMKNKAKFSKLTPLPSLKTVQKVNYISESQKGTQQQGCNEHQCTGPSSEQKDEYEEL